MPALDDLLAPGVLRTLLLSRESTPNGSILWVTLNRPAAFNAISQELLGELHQVLDALQAPNDFFDEAAVRGQPRVVVLRGAGKAFCAGVDIKAADRGVGGRAWDYRDMRSQQLLARAVTKLREIPQPVVAAVHGVASGAGCALAMAADVRLATTGARFNASFVRIGLTGCDMGTSYFLPRNLPLGVASEMMLTGRMLGAERAHALGLVNQLVDGSSGSSGGSSGGGSGGMQQALEGAARAMAVDMLAASPEGLRLTKAQLNAAADGQSLRGAVAAENAAQMFLVHHPEAAGVAQAWLKGMMARSGSSGGSSGGGTPHSKL